MEMVLSDTLPVFGIPSFGYLGAENAVHYWINDGRFKYVVSNIFIFICVFVCSIGSRFVNAVSKFLKLHTSWRILLLYFVEYVIVWGVYRHFVKNIYQENVGKTNTAKFK